MKWALSKPLDPSARWRPNADNDQKGQNLRARRALSHVGGKISLQGGSASLRETLRDALLVSSAEEETRRHVHGFHPYPARLHPQTARRLLEGLSEPGQCVLDPFCGSGTVLVEGGALGRRTLGVDLNPLSVALSRCKVAPGDPKFRGRWIRAAHAVGKAADKDRRNNVQPERHYTSEEQDSFEVGVFTELDRLSSHIANVEEAEIRSVLELILSSMLIKVSHREGDGGQRERFSPLSSGYTIRFFRDRAVEFGRQMSEYVKILPSPLATADVYQGDARQLSAIEDASVDLIVTSPPYPGVYDYYSHHDVRLRWLGLESTDFEANEIGAKRRLSTQAGADAIAAWRSDLDATLRAMHRVLREGAHACLVLADTAVAGRVFLADELVTEAAKGADMDLLAVASQERPHFHDVAREAFAGKPKREHVIVLSCV